MKENFTNTSKRACCRYDPSVDFEGARGGLRIFLPTVRGYVNFNLVHSVKEDRNCDMWRISKAYAFDDRLENEYELTPKGAEWDMAVKLDGRPDFVGGYAHGDELYTTLSVNVDGESVVSPHTVGNFFFPQGLCQQRLPRKRQSGSYTPYSSWHISGFSPVPHSKFRLCIMTLQGPFPCPNSISGAVVMMRRLC